MRKLKMLLLMFLMLQIVVLGGEKVYASTNVITYINHIVELPAVAVEILESSEMIADKLSDIKLNAFDVDGKALQLPVKWNFSTVNLSSTGAYRLQGIVQLPEGYVLADNVNLPTIQVPVSVQRKGTPDINVYYEERSTVQKVFVFPWVSYPYPENMKVWLRKSGEKWNELTGTGLAVCEKNGMQLSEHALTVGNTYSMVVSYGNRMSKTLKFSYGIDKTINKISYQNEFVGNASNPSQCISSYDEEFLKYADRYYAEALPIGTNLRTLIEKVSKTAILSVSTLENFEDTEENPALKLEAQWNLSAVDMETPGVYKITGKYILPEGYSIKKELELPMVNVYVSVQEEGMPQIDTCYFVNEHTLCFPILLQGLTPEQYKSVKIYLKKFGGEFADITGKGAYTEADRIYLDASKYIQNNSSYEIYAEYQDGCTEVYAFTCKEMSIINELRFDKDADTENPDDEGDSDDEAEEDGEDDENSEDMENGESDDGMNDSEDDDSEGSDDGYSGGYGGGYYSSYSGSGYSEDSSNDSTTTTSAASSNVTITESETDTTTILSGKSLIALLEEAGKELVFEKKGISVQLSETLVKGWGMQENDSFKISIQIISDKGFSIRVFVKDEEIKDIPGTIVKLPMSEFIGISNPDEVEVSDIEGNIYSGTYDNTKGILEISLNKSGDYFMDDGQEHSEETEGFLDDENLMDDETGEEVPVDEEFWEDEELFADDPSEDEEIFEDEFMEDGEVYAVDEFAEGEEAFMDEEPLYDGEFGDEDTEGEEQWYDKIITKVFDTLDEMKEKGTLIPAAVSIGAALILLVLFAGRKRKK